MKVNIIKIIIIVCFLIQRYCSYAQLSTNESPVSFSLHKLQWHASTVTLPPLDMAIINMEDSIDEANDNPPRFGYPHNVNLTLENAGEWKVLPDGELRQLNPNPAENQVRIGYALSRNISTATLQILNGSGQVVYSQALSGGNGSKVTGEAVVNNHYPPNIYVNK